jgi:hypothetical protein
MVNLLRISQKRENAKDLPEDKLLKILGNARFEMSH